MNYLVSTIQLNALVNRPFLRNMLAFADQHNVTKIYLYVMPGKNKDESFIPEILSTNERIELLFLDKNGKKLNNNLKLYDTGILASQINPLTGFNKKLHRDYSYILPSPKIRYASIPNTSKHPRFLATTGALTHGNYKLHTAQGRKAELEHEYGFSFVKVTNSRKFTFHPVMAMKNGKFNYYREHYTNGTMVDQQPEAIVLGDWHTGDTCSWVRAETIKMLETVRPKRAVFHDLFNGHSINHHERRDTFSKAQLWKNKIHVLREEIDQCRKEVNFFAAKFPHIQFIVAESNHDLFLREYIGQSFLEDGQNSVFGCKLFVALDTDPVTPILKTAMLLVGNVAKNVIFLDEDDEYRIKGTGLGIHGHRGANGSRGSALSFSNNNLKLITAHGHSPWIHANGLAVGTSTKKKLGYTKGPSSWEHAHVILYQTGKCTLITLIH